MGISGLAQGVEPFSKVSGADRIHPGDLIEIDELGGFDFDWRGRLNPEGYLDKFEKSAEPIFGLCSTTEDLAEKIQQAYAKTLRNPRVKVRILDRSERPAAILDGAVRQPSRFSIRRDVDLVELIALSGGFTDRAGGGISIFRPTGQNCESDTDESRMISLTIAEILSGDPIANPRILSGDMVTIEEVVPVYVIGGVNRPGKVDWRPGSTVSRAIAAAGGVSGRGVSGNLTIYRRSQGSASVFEVDLDKIASDGPNGGKEVKVEPYDILDVPLKGSPKRIQPPVVEDGDRRSARSPLPLRVVD